MRIPSGVTDQYIYFVAVDATDFSTRETGLSSFTVYRSRNGAAAAAMTTPTVNETDTTNMPGVYELLLDEDMTIAAGNDSEEMVFHITATGMAPVTRTIELYRPKITAGNTLDVTATGAAGIDWGNVENPTTTVDLSATTIDSCDDVTGAVGSVTAAVTLPTIPTNWISAAGIAASALDGKGDWNIGKTGYSLTQTFPTNFADLSITATTGRVDVAAIAGTAQTANDNGADINAILIDTNDLQTNQGNWLTATGFSTHSAADVADAVLDEDMTAHQTAGTLGGAIGDPGANSASMYNAVITDAAGASIAADVIALKAVADGVQADLDNGTDGLGAIKSAVDGIPTSNPTAAAIADAVLDEALSGHVTAGTVGKAIADIETDATAILADTAEIGAAGAGLTAIPWNAAWDAEVQSEVDDALTAYDPPTFAEMEARTPTAGQLAYMVDHAATALPVTFTGGTTTTAILANVDGSAASGTNDAYNNRVLVFNAGSLNAQVAEITDYNGTTKTATITAVTTAVLGTHTAIMI